MPVRPVTLNVILLTSLCLLFSTLSNSIAFGDQPLEAPKDAPKFKLNNFRVKNGRFGRPVIAADYQRTRKGKGTWQVEMVLRGKSGEINVMGFSRIWDDSGEIVLSDSFPNFGDGEIDYELYLSTRADWGGKNFGRCMVSNAVRIGNPGSKTIARRWNSEEKSAWERHLKGKKPPESLPSGYEPVYLSTKLLPGMMVMAGHFGEWKEAELLSISDDGNASVRFVGEMRVTKKPIEKWLSVDPKQLAEAEKNPEKFQPSMRVLDSGRLGIPDNAIALGDDVQLVPGTPLLYERGFKWGKAYVQHTTENEVTVRYEGMRFDRKHPRSYFAIAKSTLKKLDDDDAESSFASNLKNQISGSGSRSDEIRSWIENAESNHRSLVNRSIRQHNRRVYAIEAPIPNGAVVVPSDLAIPEGTELAACRFGKWDLVRVLNENEDGSLEVNFFNINDSWNETLDRDLLIIRTKTLEKLRTKSGVSESELAKKFRTWKDKSGNYTVDAKFVSKTDTEVVLATESGETKTVPIAKLSDEDQELLRNLKKDVENPFK